MAEEDKSMFAEYDPTEKPNDETAPKPVYPSNRNTAHRLTRRGSGCKPAKKKRNQAKLTPEKRKAIFTARAHQNRPITVHLTMRHTINGVSYGPGDIRLSKSIAEALLHTEQHALKIEEQFQGTKGAIIGPQVNGQHVVRQVPVETFDTSLMQAEPFTAIKVNQ